MLRATKLRKSVDRIFAPRRHLPAHPQPKTSPPPTAPPAPNACGAPANPWNYNFCGGSLIYVPPQTFCTYFACIGNFWNGRGYYGR